MEEGKVFLTMLAVLFGGVIAWIVYTNISNNMAKNSKNIAKKAELIIKKDMSSKCARCTFYMNNDYDNGYSQSEWLKLFKESVTDKEWGKNSQEYTEAVHPLLMQSLLMKETIMCAEVWRKWDSTHFLQGIMTEFLSITL